jgi:murein peptide amidase A
MSRRGSTAFGALLAVAVLGGCSNVRDDDADAGSGAGQTTTTALTAAATTAEPATTPTSTTSAPTTTTSAPTTTLAPTTATLAATTDAPTTPAPTTTGTPTTLAASDEEIVLGESVEGRPITVIRRGDPGGTAVLVVGVIHGDEPAGSAIVDLLRMLPVPEGIELWLVPSANPDGQAAGTRHNANGVDLNRNFPENWGPIAGPGDWQYAGPGAASEPETQAMMRLTEMMQPDLTLWYHQDLFRISPGRGLDGEVRARYAELTGLPLVEVTGGTYTGTASTWSRAIAADGGVGFTVELGESLTPEDARRHADAVLTVAEML